jgi:probable rRNA maturation factor
MSDAKPVLSLTVQYASAAATLPTRPQWRRWIKAALQRDVTMTLRIVDEAEGRELNKAYRGRDYATNVLTFVYDDTEQPQDARMEQSDNEVVAGRQLPQSAADFAGSNVSQPPLSGDVVICAPVVESEAEGRDLEAHYAHMAIHAALHLQGYDHEEDADAVKMEALESALMVRLRYPDPYMEV